MKENAMRVNLGWSAMISLDLHLPLQHKGNLVESRKLKLFFKVKMKKYEYKILTISAFHLNKPTFQAELDESFKKWGDEGWELVKMEPVNGGAWIFWGRTSKFLTVFKREKQ